MRTGGKRKGGRSLRRFFGREEKRGEAWAEFSLYQRKEDGIRRL